MLFPNSLDTSLKFTMKYGGNELYCLDLKLTLVHNKIQATMRSKPTENHLYLQADS